MSINTNTFIGSPISNVFNVSGTLTNNLTGSYVSVTGSSALTGANFSGVGGTLVYTLGNQVLISGAGSNSAGGGTTTLARFTTLDNSPPATAFATFDTSNNIPVLCFDAVTGETGIFSSIMPQGAIFTNGIDARLFFRAAGGTTGAVIWNIAFETGNNINADSWATGINSTGAPANGTLGIQTVATITFNSGEIGAVTAGDFFRVRASRVAISTGDTMTGDAQFTALEIRQR